MKVMLKYCVSFIVKTNIGEEKHPLQTGKILSTLFRLKCKLVPSVFFLKKCSCVTKKIHEHAFYLVSISNTICIALL